MYSGRGRGNHFAPRPGLTGDDVIGALDAFTDGVERRIDLARVNEHVFVNNASLGVYAEVVQSDAYRDAKLETWTQMLPELLGPGAPADRSRVRGPDGTEIRRCATRARLEQSLPAHPALPAPEHARASTPAGFGIVAARITAASDIAEFVMLETIGQAQRFHGLLEWSEIRFEVRSSSPVAVGLDGEALMLEPPLQFVSLPGALRVRLPERASDGAAGNLQRHSLETTSGPCPGSQTGHPHG